MKYKIIACYDVTLEAFMPPQAVNDMLDEDIVESNRRAVVNGTIPADKAERLILFKFGTFDDVQGALIPLGKPERLCVLSSFLPRKVESTEVKDNGSVQSI